MLKKDIRTGVVYAYQRNNRASPVPLVFLSLDLHTYPRPRREGLPWCVPAPSYRKPERGSIYPDVGYPVVIGQRAGRGVPPAGLAAMTALGAGVITAGLTEAQHELSLSTDILVSLGKVTGAWADVAAGHAAAREQERVAREAELERHAARLDRAGIARAVLGRHDISASWRPGVHGGSGRVELTLEDAEKLAALLDSAPSSPAQPGEGD